MKKLTIFFYIVYQDGTGYYRMWKPAMMIKKLGLANVIVNPFSAYGSLKDTWTDFNPGKNGVPKCSFPIANVFAKHKPDAIICQRSDTMNMFSLAMSIKGLYGVPVIQETDDYVWDVPGSNPGSLSYYEKKPEAQTTIDEPMTMARMTQGNYDAYITTTSFLEQYFKNYSPTYICPNSIDLSERKMPKRKGHKGIRIMYTASAGHYDGYKMIEEPINKILEKHPEVTFYQNDFFTNVAEGKPWKKQVKMMKWVHPTKYPQYIDSFEPDICLAPLRDRLFNRSKSNLRLMEYWTSGKNAVIASPVGHYKETATDGKNVIFAKDNWVERIEYLIKHPEIRKKIGEGGYELVKKDFNLEKNARKWVDAVRQIIRDYDPDRTPPDQYIPPEFRGGEGEPTGSE